MQIAGDQMVQGTLDDLGTPLPDVTFVVVDLETTGGSPADTAITEIGAVKVRGGEVLGEFQTLVRPRASRSPPFIQCSPGSPTRWSRDAPRIEAVLPAFLEFARGSVLVAHNAPFDVGVPQGGGAGHRASRGRVRVVDTVHLARQLVTPRRGAATTSSPRWRRVPGDDHARPPRAARRPGDGRRPARAARPARQPRGPHAGGARQLHLAGQRRRSAASATWPTACRTRRASTCSRTATARCSTSARRVNIRTRVRSYFTASEKRTRMTEMVGSAERSARSSAPRRSRREVRELRLIAEHKPRYNRRSRFPERATGSS